MARTAAIALCAALALSGCAGATSGGTTATSIGSTTETSTAPVALWIGDSYTAGAGATSSATGEALATSAALGWQTDMDAEGGTGFVAAGHAASPSNAPLPDRLAADAARFPDPNIVLIDAGRNDLGHPLAKFRRAVRSSFRMLARDEPSAAVVVIAPYLMRSKPGDYLALRRFLGQQARRHGWAFVDPLAEGWINKTSARLVVSDGVHPNQAGYDYIVAHLAPAIEKALAAAHEKVS